MHEARDALSRALGQVDAMVTRGKAADRQQERLLWVGGGGFLLGILLLSFLMGAIARSLPESWHVPEWIAARTMAMEQKVAGRRMIETVDDQQEAEFRQSPMQPENTTKAK